MNLHDQFFRREAARMVAALTRIFGVHNLALAQDVVQDAFCQALASWDERGVPHNGAAWLMATAKNRALDIIRRERTARTFAPELGRLLQTEWTLVPAIEEAFAPETVQQQQLRMMFSCCHPRLPQEVQLALILNVLCGFGPDAIASAFLCGRAAIEKRISRGKRALAEARRVFDLGDAEFAARLGPVQRALYLLFNEGYHGASAQSPVRGELCAEALHLVSLLCAHAPAATPETTALAALMCLHAARLPARIDAAGDLSALAQQDRSQWDARLLGEGLHLLEHSASGDELSAYHVEAAIAAVHASAPRVDQTDWRLVVALYDRLMLLSPSPVVALNRAIAIGERDGPRRGIAALLAIAERERLGRYPFYAAALGELELRRGERRRAREHFTSALAVARNPPERRFLEKRIRYCGD